MRRRRGEDGAGLDSGRLLDPVIHRQVFQEKCGDQRERTGATASGKSNTSLGFVDRLFPALELQTRMSSFIDFR